MDIQLLGAWGEFIGVLQGADIGAEDRLVGAQVLSGVFRALENQYFAYKENNFSESV